MDASNPVLSADRFSGKHLQSMMVLKARQNLTYLTALAETATRRFLPVDDRFKEAQPDEIKKAVKEYRAERLPPVDMIDMDLEEVAHVIYDRMPVCGVLDNLGVPIHPPTINNKKGAVNVQRTYGGLWREGSAVVPTMEILARDWKDYATHIYTSGSPQGLKKRILKQMGRKSVSVKSAVASLLSTAKPALGAQIDLVLRHLGFDKNRLGGADLNGDFMDLFREMQITSVASAGPPYWKDKLASTDVLLSTTLPLIIDHLKKDSCKELFQKQPEMFLCELKNKTDRYTWAEAEGEKTRPYFCIPYHWATLFSILTQKFQEALTTFEKSRLSSSAYGFSSSHGGLRRMVEWMKSVPRNSAKLCCYGDDTCIVYRNRKGELYRIDPDFTQMDGSVDADLIRLVINTVKSALFEKWGANSLWAKVCDWWLWFAVNPMFMVQGTNVWQKKNCHGLMTGIPGTTLFDTVKSILSWQYLINELEHTNDLEHLMNEQFVTAFMLKSCGLEIKPGTYEPERVFEDPGDNGFFTSHKFLGVKIQLRSYQGQDVYVPYVDESEILTQLLSPKDSPSVAKTMSVWARQRLEFDRCRGIYITSAFAHERTTAIIHNIVNSLPGGPIMMSTQFENGQPPETILLPEFQFPNSAGFPTYDFVMKLYGEFEEEGEFLNIFEGLDDELKVACGSLRAAKLSMRAPDEEGVRDVYVAEATPPEYDLPSLLDQGKDKALKEPDTKEIKINKYTTTVKGSKEEKHFPNLLTSLYRLVKEVESCDDVLEVTKVMEVFGLSKDLVLRALRGSNLYCADGYISSKPIYAQAQQLVKPIQVESVAKTAPIVLKSKMTAKIESSFVKRLKRDLVFPVSVHDELQILNFVVGKSGFSCKYVTASVDARKDKPVNVLLLYAPIGSKEFTATGASAWGKRALDCKVAIAKELLAASGYSGVTTLPLETKRLEPREFKDWSEEVEYESKSIRAQPTELTIDMEPIPVPALIQKALSASAYQKYAEADEGFKKKVESVLSDLYQTPKEIKDTAQIKENHERKRITVGTRSKQAEKPREAVAPAREQDIEGGSVGSSTTRLSPTQRRNLRRRNSVKKAKEKKQTEEPPANTGTVRKPTDRPASDVRRPTGKPRGPKDI
uniref:RNA-dependent RNA polymerase n=2 Tax=Riboviria sp. TaxID=2585031 RepID=A0A8K1N2R1_9VIRU|nr:MAG: RNA-dependent RNA polymerase [Riboviria sp.]